MSTKITFTNLLLITVLFFQNPFSSFAQEMLWEKDLKEELFNIRMQVSTQQITNYARIKQLKKDIARLETVKREKRV